MSVLDTIIDHKRGEVARAKQRLPLAVLQSLLPHISAPRGFANALRTGSGPRIIAEVKRASPSKGVLRPQDPPGAWDPARVAQAYEQGGAACLSVLTDVHYFWGHPDALGAARDATQLPALRKDFMIDAYQIYESRWLGADAILLIARSLSGEQLLHFASIAQDLNMDVLIEIHDEKELIKALEVPGQGVMIGVNNRDLSTLTVDPQRSARMRALIPADRLMVAESGLSEPHTIATLQNQGVGAFLIGEHLVKSSDACLELKRLRGETY